MGKTKEAAPSAKQNGQTGVAKTTPAQLSKQDVLPIEAIAEQMKEMTEGMEVTSEYLKLEIDQTVRVGVIGLHRMESENSEDEDGRIECIRMITEDAKIAIGAQAILVSTLRDAAVRFQTADPKDRKMEFFSITCTDKEDRGGGKKLSRLSIKQLI